MLSKVKSKVHPITGHEGPEWQWSCVLSLILVLHWGGWSIPRPDRLAPWKETRYPLYRRLGGPQVRSERVRKNSP